MGLCTVCHEKEATIEAAGDCPETICAGCNSPCEVCGNKQCYRCDVPCGTCGKHLCNDHRHVASVEIGGEQYSDDGDTYCDGCVGDAADDLRERHADD